MDLSRPDQGMSQINYIIFQIPPELTKNQPTEKPAFGFIRPGTVNLGSIATGGWAFFVVGAVLCYSVRCSNILGPCPIDASSVIFPGVTTKNVSRYYLMSPGGPNGKEHCSGGLF